MELPGKSLAGRRLCEWREALPGRGGGGGGGRMRRPGGGWWRWSVSLGPDVISKGITVIT